MTDTVKWFIPRREDEDLVIPLLLVSVCGSVFPLIVQRIRSTVTPHRQDSVKNTEHTKAVTSQLQSRKKAS